MTADRNNLIQRAVELTGTAPPELLDADNAVFAPASPAAREGGFYLVGLIGGKEVGKSALVNALVGRPITRPIGHGEGTAGVIAYAHAGQVSPLKELLNREVPGRFTIIPHDNAALARQVLLDLPDIDSHYADHLEITRRMLRHMIYPLWIQSIEKYADRQPQELLRKVAAGNSAENFLFCLNKVDQLLPLPGTERPGVGFAVRTNSPTLGSHSEPYKNAGAGAAEELREDFANRLAATLSLATPPKVWLISATQPQTFELPRLAATLAQQRSEDEVARSLHFAQRQRERSILAWLDALGLPQRLARVQRLEQEAQDLLAERLEPLVSPEAPGGRGPIDSAAASAVVDDLLAQRVRRWPIVNLVHMVLNPLFRLAITMTRARPAVASAAGTIVAAPPATAAIQTAFAQLQRLDPLAGELYRDGKLWESIPAESAAADLSRTLEDVIQRQQAVLRESLAPGGWSAILAPWRWLLTIGVLLWFPLIQPVAETFLTSSNKVVDVPLLIVRLLSVTALLQSVSLLVIWYVALWIYLRWHTQQRVQRRLESWQRDDLDPTLSPVAAAVAWSAGVLHPLADHRQKLESLLADIQTLRQRAI